MMRDPRRRSPDDSRRRKKERRRSPEYQNASTADTSVSGMPAPMNGSLPPGGHPTDQNGTPSQYAQSRSDPRYQPQPQPHYPYQQQHPYQTHRQPYQPQPYQQPPYHPNQYQPQHHQQHQPQQQQQQYYQNYQNYQSYPSYPPQQYPPQQHQQPPQQPHQPQQLQQPQQPPQPPQQYPPQQYQQPPQQPPQQYHQAYPQYPQPYPQQQPPQPYGYQPHRPQYPLPQTQPRPDPFAYGSWDRPGHLSDSSSDTASSFVNISRKAPKPENFGGLISTFFRAPSEQRRRGRRSRSRSRRKKSRTRFLTFGNSSSSSVDSDLAYGQGYIPRPEGYTRTPSVRTSRPGAGSSMHTPGGHQPPHLVDFNKPLTVARSKTDEEILEIGRQLKDIARMQNDADLRASGKTRPSQLASAAAALSSFRRRSKTKSSSTSRHRDTGHPDDADDSEWESASDDDSDQGDAHADAGLVYGPSAPSPQDDTAGSPPTRYKKVVAEFRDNQRRKEEEAAAAAATQTASPRTSKKDPMQYVYPVPTSDPNAFDYDRGSVAGDQHLEDTFRGRRDGEGGRRSKRDRNVRIVDERDQQPAEAPGKDERAKDLPIEETPTDTQLPETAETVPEPPAGVDPFRFQVADDAFRTPPVAAAVPDEEPQRPLIVTVDREPNFDSPRDTRFSRKDSYEMEQRMSQQYRQSSRSRSRAPEYRRSMDEEGEERTSDLGDESAPAAAGPASDLAMPMEGEEPSRGRSRDRSAADEPRYRSERELDSVLEEADRHYRETVKARKMAADEMRSRSSSRRRSVVDKYEDDEEPHVITVVPPPEVEEERQKSPYDGPNADVRIDHVLVPHELHRFTVSDDQLDGDADAGPVFKSRDPSCERDRPLLNLVLPTPDATPRASPPPETEAEAQGAEPTESAQPDVILGPRGEIIPVSSASDSASRGVDEEKAAKAEGAAAGGEDGDKPWSVPDRGSHWAALAAAIKSRAPLSDDEDSAPAEAAAADDPTWEEDDRPPTPGPKPRSPQPSPMPGSFDDDLEFASVLAAGLQDSGFDPNIVIDDPAYRRRDSPPGSDDPESGPFDQPAPVESVAERGLDLSDAPADAPAEEATPEGGFVDAQEDIPVQEASEEFKLPDETQPSEDWELAGDSQTAAEAAEPVEEPKPAEVATPEDWQAAEETQPPEEQTPAEPTQSTDDWELAGDTQPDEPTQPADDAAPLDKSLPVEEPQPATETPPVEEAPAESEPVEEAPPAPEAVPVDDGQPAGETQPVEVPLPAEEEAPSAEEPRAVPEEAAPAPEEPAPTPEEASTAPEEAVPEEDTPAPEEAAPTKAGKKKKKKGKKNMDVVQDLDTPNEEPAEPLPNPSPNRLRNQLQSQLLSLQNRLPSQLPSPSLSRPKSQPRNQLPSQPRSLPMNPPPSLQMNPPLSLLRKPLRNQSLSQRLKSRSRSRS
ncbi:hypothetical protein ACRALDRAFT_2042430 [Sodiomyces alcalophilus JCM 7366]|uniref:uncharacterized protein n=1 Tax=Sodiomyces alcalophilus JCM 7366 TaxID=591952 RepID=UPI0039B59675